MNNSGFCSGFGIFSEANMSEFGKNGKGKGEGKGKGDGGRGSWFDGNGGRGAYGEPRRENNYGAYQNI